MDERMLTAEEIMEKVKMIQTIEKSMLSIAIEVFDKMDIKYFALCGTVLGAVRHHGFIPWDDDVDLGMLRHDYERFIANAHLYLPKEIEVHTWHNDPEFKSGFCKLKQICPDGTKAFIDIFPLDYYPETNSESFYRKKKLLNWRMMIACGYKAPTWKSKLVGFLLVLRWPSVKRTLKIREKHFRSIPSSSLVANLYGPYRLKEISKLSWFGEGVFLEFDGLSLRCPVATDEYLTHLYGDYMKLPPEDQRFPKHFDEW